MDLRFLRGSPQAPKGHAIFVARSTANPRDVFYTYCVVPPLPLSLSKYIPNILASQLPLGDASEMGKIEVMPIPPVLEEGGSFDNLQAIAEHRDDDLCELGSINPHDETSRMQLAIESCGEYVRLYMNNSSSLRLDTTPGSSAGSKASQPLSPLDDLDAEELLLQTMSDRQRLAELGKLVGVARYALDGQDTQLLQDTKRRMQRITDMMPDKYKGSEVISVAMTAGDRPARIAELYLERAYKLLDEEYAEIPRIERTIRDLQDS